MDNNKFTATTVRVGKVNKVAMTVTAVYPSMYLTTSLSVSCSNLPMFLTTSPDPHSNPGYSWCISRVPIIDTLLIASPWHPIQSISW